jgi:hypothetical protein
VEVEGMRVQGSQCKKGKEQHHGDEDDSSEVLDTVNKRTTKEVEAMRSSVLTWL